MKDHSNEIQFLKSLLTIIEERIIRLKHTEISLNLQDQVCDANSKIKELETKLFMLSATQEEKKILGGVEK